VRLGLVFLRVFSVFPCQYCSTMALHTHISSGGWSPQFRDVVSPHRHKGDGFELFGNDMEKVDIF
jgi:hypothetical protein